MKKSLLFGLLAVLAAVFIFTACDNGTTTEYQYIPVPGTDTETLIHIDTVAANEAALTALLADEDYADKVIGIASGITLTADLDIPADYTVYLLNTGSLVTAPTFGLTVEGTLWVGYGATLSVPSGGDPITVEEGGLVSVVTGGNLSIQEVTDIDGAVTIANGTLTVDAVADADELAAAFALVSSGNLVVTTATADVKASEAAGLAVSANKKVTIEATKTETADALTIPAGLTLAASGDLSTVESFTVSGSLDTTGATLIGTAITVTVGLDGSLTLGAAATLGTSTVDGALVLGGATGLDDAAALTVTGTLGLGATDLTLGTDAVLAIADPDDVSGTGAIIAEDGTITIGSGEGAVEGFTTEASGVVGDDLAAALTALEGDYAVVAPATYVALNGFGTDPGNAIGTVPIIADATATAVKDDTDGGDAGDAVTLDTGSEFEGTPTITVGGTNANDVSNTDFTLSTNSGALEIADGEYDDDSGDKLIILTFAGLQIKNSGFISPAVLSASFSIGVKTSR